MRTSLRVLVVSLSALGAWPGDAVADGGAVSCPQQIDTAQNLSKPVEGFEAAKGSGNTFWSGITFYEGRPEQMVALKYDSEADSGDGSYELTWNLDPKTEYWIECRYDSTSILLVKKLPPVSACKVSTSAAQEMAMQCR
jgi:hypothetical protein